MSIGRHAGNSGKATVKSPESMYDTIRALGIVPFFENCIKGYSIEELTPAEFWFDGDSDTLGPWDWKIYAVQSGDIAYGKFLLGGKAAFATVEWYRELMNYRRSLDRYTPHGDLERILKLVEEKGSAGIKDIRMLLGVKKSAADAAVTRLQMQTRLVTGDITRVYRGQDLHYNGWQLSSFCRPEDLFDAPGIPFGPFKDESAGLRTDHSPGESYEILRSHILSLFPGAGDREIERILR